jgi:hypothetical protein
MALLTRRRWSLSRLLVTGLNSDDSLIYSAIVCSENLRAIGTGTDSLKRNWKTLMTTAS